MSTVTRRSALATLGLSAAAGGAAAVETIGAESTAQHGFKFGLPKPEMIAGALEKLAAEVRAGRAYVQESQLLTQVKIEDYVHHVLTVDFILPDDVKTS